MHEPVERAQFVAFEKLTSAYLHQIAKEMILLLIDNLHERSITQSQVRRNLDCAPDFQTLDNERLHLRSAVTSSEARLDIKAVGFWSRGVTAFFYVRVTHVNSKCYQNKTTSEVFKEQEDEKKRKYQQRVLDVEMGSFTPLVFGTNGGMGNECQRFLKHLADKIAQKDTEPYNTVIAWLRTQISFELRV